MLYKEEKEIKYFISWVVIKLLLHKNKKQIQENQELLLAKLILESLQLKHNLPMGQLLNLKATILPMFNNFKVKSKSWKLIMKLLIEKENFILESWEILKKCYKKEVLIKIHLEVKFSKYYMLLRKSLCTSMEKEGYQ